jgi:GxxExxY protein
MADTVRDSRTHAILGAAFRLHATLRNGFLEAVYQEAMSIELTERGIPYRREVDLPITYRNQTLKTAYRADFVCYDSIIRELKAISALGDIEAAQVLNYLNATGLEIGLLINFATPSLEYRRLTLSCSKQDDAPIGDQRVE